MAKEDDDANSLIDSDNDDEITPPLTPHSHSVTAPMGVMSPSASGGYEEFFGGTIPCPTCRGAGRIPREKEHQLVALIPLSDKRLRPSRTWWYVSIAVLCCLVIGGLLAYFLFPRGIRLLSNSPTLQPTYLYVNTTEEVVYLTIINQYNVSNDNFYGVSVNDLSVTVTFDEHVIAKSENDTTSYIPLRTQKLHTIVINVTFSGDEGYIANYCANQIHRAHTIFMPFEATLKSSYFGGTFENTLLTYQHVRCTAKSNS